MGIRPSHELSKLSEKSQIYAIIAPESKAQKADKKKPDYNRGMVWYRGNSGKATGD